MENEIELLSQDGKVVVSSRVVAQDFGKQHKHVLEAIKNLELQLNTVEFSALFIESKYKAIKVSDTNLSIGNFAKQTTLGRNELFKFLRENKILFYNDGNNVPYQKYVKQGYFKCTQTVTNNHINVTPKGQEWLFKKFNVLKRGD